MWLRHALKLIAVTLVISACSPSDRQQVDKLNSLSYAYHYRDIDSTEYYAQQALRLSDNADVQAEALNNLAFVSMVRMDYDRAQQQLDSVALLTDNQIELLVADVQQMRLCQRHSRNRDFYDYRERAVRALARVNEERDDLSPRQESRLVYAESELAIVTSTYYYYVGLERQSSEALMAIDPELVESDTAQFLNYLYNIGAGGILTEGTQEEVSQQELDCLLRCFQIASQYDYPYFAANAQEAMAEHLTDAESRQRLIENNAAGFAMVCYDNITDDDLPLWLADQALMLFRAYGDVYQIAGANRTLATCFRAQGDYEGALYYLEQALTDTLINQAPDLVASIYEQLSVAYAAVNDKPSSDHYRNLYLDLQEQTRQDRQLEARASQLESTVSQLNWILLAVVAAIILLLFLLWLFNHLNRKQRRANPLDDLMEERQEELAVRRLHLEKAQRLNLEQRAKVSLVNTITPLIDRMLHEANRLQTSEEPASSEALDIPENSERLEYIRELTEKIEQDNTLLTQWIQLRQGELSLRIESFPLQTVFDIVARSRRSFLMKELTLDVQPTIAVVKADRILTLFMINTLADNARKFTKQGGTVTVSAAEADSYVEVSVNDTGIGMTGEQLAHVFEHKVEGGHGFGLLNCKGIIEKYRKTSQIFSVCTLQAESEEGRGSRFFFRLPKGKMMSLFSPVALIGLIGLMSLMSPTASYAEQKATVEQTVVQPSTAIEKAAVYADSAYFSNINGEYAKTLRFADSCRQCLNDHYRRLHPQGTVFLLGEGDTSVTPPEVVWLHDSVATNYHTILDMRNESAVAALALHEWQLYQYNNRIYTQLFKELSADNTLSDYCRTMQQSRTNRTIALILFVVMLIAIVPAYYFLYLRHRLYERYTAERQQRDDVETIEDDIRRADLELAKLHVSNAVLDNCLSALKHETMYYPSRIRQLIDQQDLTALPEVTAYYRELYGLLSEQAQNQADRTRLHLTRLEHGILGDEVQIRYLFDILKRMTGQKQLELSYQQRDEQYVELTLNVPSPITNEASPMKSIDQLLCRQIARDHGEASHRRGCSIREEQNDNETKMIITLPAYGKLQSNHS